MNATLICKSKFGNMIKSGNASVEAFRLKDGRIAVRVNWPAGMDLWGDIYRFADESEGMAAYVTCCASVRKRMGEYVPA